MFWGNLSGLFYDSILFFQLSAFQFTEIISVAKPGHCALFLPTSIRIKNAILSWPNNLLIKIGFVNSTWKTRLDGLCLHYYFFYILDYWFVNGHSEIRQSCRLIYGHHIWSNIVNFYALLPLFSGEELRDWGNISWAKN